jgi:DNA-binding NtrC family response regulator
LIDLGYALTVVIVGSYDNGVFVTVKESIPTPLKITSYSAASSVSDSIPLITDYGMPGINGIELSEYCYEQCGSKNILVSGHSNIPYSSSLLKFFKKPFSILKLMEYVLEIKNEKNTLDNPSINPIFETSTSN